MSISPALPDQRKPVKAFIFAILLFETFALFVRSYVQLELRESGLSADDAKHLSYLVVPIILGILMYPILRDNQAYLCGLFETKYLRPRLIITAVAVGMLARIVWWSQLVARISFGVTTNSDPSATVGPEFSFGCPGLHWLLLGILVMAVLVPFIEEIINRGLIQSSLMRQNRLFAIIVSAFLFAVYHPFAGIPFVFVFGVVFGIQFANTRTLWATVITHATYNGMLQIDWGCAQTRWNPRPDDLPLICAGTIALLTLVFSMTAICYLISAKWTGASTAPRSAMLL